MTPRIVNRNLHLIPLLPWKRDEREKVTQPLLPIPTLWERLEALARSKLRASVSEGEETMLIPMP